MQRKIKDTPTDRTASASQMEVERVLLDPIASIEEQEKDRQFVTALARGLELLRCFSPRESVLSNQDLARKANLPRPTVSRLTYTLTRLGCLKQLPQGKYQLDVGVMGLGYSMLSNLSIRAAAHPLMEQMANHAKAAVAMAARDRLQMVYLDVVHGQGNVTMRRQVGTRLPLHLSAVGRACLAALPENECDFLLDHIRERHAEDWPKIRRGLEKSFRDYADYGYCLSVGEWNRDVNAVAVPLVHAQHGLLAFNCGGPSFQLSREHLEEDIGPRLVHMVSNIAAGTR